MRDGKITVMEAARRMGKRPQFVRIGLQRGTLPIGSAVKIAPRRWSYWISPVKFEEYIGKLEGN